MSELKISENIDIDKTVVYIFQQAINCERKNRDIYIQFSKMFGHISKIHSFWIDLAKDEEKHARTLEDIYGSLDDGYLKQKADSELLISIQNIISNLDMINLNHIKNLDYAYEIAHDIENSEINNVFKILATEYISEYTRKNAISSELKLHVDKLMDFNKTFGDKNWRKEITSQSLAPKSY